MQESSLQFSHRFFRAEDLFGYAVHHLLRARFCIERGRLLQAEYWVSSARDYALNLACLMRGISAPLGVPAIRDRVVMMGAVLVLAPIFEADLQSEQYAYRRGRKRIGRSKTRP
jgi:hypothetical protein